MSSFGTLFKVSTFGESHCKGVGCIVEGMPSGVCISESDIQVQLNRRRPGQSSLTTPRDEKDIASILSGTECGISLGSPISVFVKNEDQRPRDYNNTDEVPRPSHADLTYIYKYGIKSSSGGGRASARETIGRVAAGAIAECYLKTLGIEIVAFTHSVGQLEIPKEMLPKIINTISRNQVDEDITKCPHAETAKEITKLIIKTRDDKDSIGGTITCVIRNVPAGLGEPCFDKLEAKLAHAMLSIPATKGFEIGSGFEGSKMLGHVHNDRFIKKHNLNGDVKLGTVSNHSGGIQGGISNGEPIYFRVAFKPAATIGQSQSTVTFDGDETILQAKGRHDPCVIPRAIPIVESMAALVIMDYLLIQGARINACNRLPEIPDLDVEDNLGKRRRMLLGGGKGKPQSIQ